MKLTPDLGEKETFDVVSSDEKNCAKYFNFVKKAANENMSD
jgi:hypothetical protein